MAGPLEGVRVLDLTSVLLGPFATMLLGDMGADIIKIEGPEGDTTRTTGPSRNPGMSAFFLLANRSKRSIVLDLKQPVAAEALWKLIDTADVFIHSIRPQAIARLGFGPDEVLARNPRIVYAGAHGFSEDGPYGGQPAYDDIIQAACGLSALMEKVVGEPMHTPMVTADKTVGLSALYAILAALFARERTGRGQFVEIPMLEVMTHFVLTEHMYGHVFDPPLDQIGYPRVLAKWRRPYKTKDGWLAMLAYTDRQWAKFVTEAGRPDLASDPRFTTLGARTKNIEQVYAHVGELLPARTTDEWVETLERLEIPCMRVNQLEDLQKDPHLRAIGFFKSIDHPTEGKLTLPGPPVRFAATPAEIRRPPERLGESSVAILREAGVPEQQVEAMLASGATMDGRSG